MNNFFRLDLEYVEFLDTTKMELSGGEFTLSREGRVTMFQVMIGLGSVQLLLLSYYDHVFKEISNIFLDIHLILSRMTTWGWLLKNLVYILLLIDGFRLFTLYNAIKRDSDPENQNRNPSPPVYFQILLYLSFFTVICLMAFCKLFTSNLDDLNANLAEDFLKVLSQYFDDPNSKYNIDRFQLTQNCCGIGNQSSEHRFGLIEDRFYPSQTINQAMKELQLNLQEYNTRRINFRMFLYF